MSEASPSSPWVRLLRVLGLRGHTPEPQEAADLSGADPARLEHARERRLAAEAFDRLRVEDVMVPRADIIAVDVTASLREVTQIFAHNPHSRLPVYRDTLDEPLGMVHIRDVMRHLAPSVGDGFGDATVQLLDRIRRPVLFVPPSMPAADLLLKMQSRRIHMALVVDEFGGTDGLLTLEDLVEEIVGDIEDEHDSSAAPMVRPRGGACWDADARCSIEDFEAIVNRTLGIEDLTEDVDTLGGLVFTLAGRVPERGEVIPHPQGLEFEVSDADPRRIKRLLVRRSDGARPRVNGAAAPQSTEELASP